MRSTPGGSSTTSNAGDSPHIAGPVSRPTNPSPITAAATGPVRGPCGPPGAPLGPNPARCIPAATVGPSSGPPAAEPAPNAGRPSRRDRPGRRCLRFDQHGERVVRMKSQATRSFTLQPSVSVTNRTRAWSRGLASASSLCSSRSASVRWVARLPVARACASASSSLAPAGRPRRRWVARLPVARACASANALGQQVGLGPAGSPGCRPRGPAPRPARSAPAGRPRSGASPGRRPRGPAPRRARSAPAGRPRSGASPGRMPEACASASSLRSSRSASVRLLAWPVRSEIALDSPDA